uniref:Uncharacterized protein n=1 Tax=Ascaris lumbricoides TaxID=6252 RepID=A0A9J2P2M2_ASCLU
MHLVWSKLNLPESSPTLQSTKLFNRKILKKLNKYVLNQDHELLALTKSKKFFFLFKS